jgi:hypothetical protein
VPDLNRRDILRKRTTEVIKASVEPCCSTRENVARSETIVRLSRQPMVSSIAILSRVKHASLSGPLHPTAASADRQGHQTARPPRK